MDTPTIFLILVSLTGLAFLGGVRLARTIRARRILRWSGCVLTGLLALGILTPAYLVTRLDGSTPPGLLEFLAGYWLPVGLIVLVEAALFTLFQKDP